LVPPVVPVAAAADTPAESFVDGSTYAAGTIRNTGPDGSSP
jgi:hypothetical protein